MSYACTQCGYAGFEEVKGISGDGYCPRCGCPFPLACLDPDYVPMTHAEYQAAKAVRRHARKLEKVTS